MISPLLEPFSLFWKFLETAKRGARIDRQTDETDSYGYDVQTHVLCVDMLGIGDAGGRDPRVEMQFRKRGGARSSGQPCFGSVFRFL